jgi:hypothetical protein
MIGSEIKPTSNIEIQVNKDIEEDEKVKDIQALNM